LFGFMRKKSAPAPSVDLSVFFDGGTYPQDFVRYKHACIGDFRRDGEAVTLSGCTCSDYQKWGRPCSHMFALALDSGVYAAAFSGHENLEAAIGSLSGMAMKQLAAALYSGRYGDVHSVKELGRYLRPIEAAGLACVDGDSFVWSDEVQSNLYFVLHYLYSVKGCGEMTGLNGCPVEMQDAVIYARYSSHSQRDCSIEQQVADCEVFASQNNLRIVKVYADRHLSGTSDKRPEFQRMLKTQRMAGGLLWRLGLEHPPPSRTGTWFLPPRGRSKSPMTSPWRRRSVAR